MKIYTKSGDDGSTGTLGNGRLSKSHLLVEVLGTLDHLNACLGVVVAYGPSNSIRDQLENEQGNLLAIGAELASSAGDNRFVVLDLESSVSKLETDIDGWEVELPPLTQFILPGGSFIAAHAHVARTVCRLAERRVIQLSLEKPIRKEILAYFNRLSDWLFVLARYLNQVNKSPETIWRNQ